MSLPGKDVQLYYKLHWSLLYYVNKKHNIIKGIKTPDQLKKAPLDETYKLREKLYKDTKLIDSYVHENPSKLPPGELEIVADWKHFINKSFIILKTYKKYTVFLDEDTPPRAYGVLSLVTPIEEIFESPLPLLVDAVLLPYKNSIIYDGIMMMHNIIFGRGILSDFNETYREAKARFGVIQSLPFNPHEKKLDEAETLKLYLRSERSREEHWDEIIGLIQSSDELLILYHQEMGKIDARGIGRRLRKIGLRKAWFALLEGTLIAGASTKEKLEETLMEILPAEKKRFVFLYYLK
jgi:hypothetical protein